MYHKKSSSANSRSNYRGGGKQTRSYQGNNTRRTKNGNRSNYSNRRQFSRFSNHKQGFFDPSMLIKKAISSPANSNLQTKVEIKNTFADLDINPLLKQNILARGYENLTPIQDQTIPLILNYQDVIGLANTGTGKTAAFLIPLIHNLLQQKSGRVLIMAPTRELAIQIETEFKIFARRIQLFSSLCIGGASIQQQLHSLRRNSAFVIGTPGRLIDLEKRQALNLSSFSAIVLDEVDRMLDMGFIHDMKYMIARLPAKRHSLFFSATFPSKLDEIVQSFLTNPVKIKIENQRLSASIEQDIIKINGQSKLNILHNLLTQKGFDKVLIFGRTKHGLNKLDKNLYEKGIRVATIHGNKTQSQRQKALRQFKNNFVQVLLATDIASRGLDIDDVTHVINYDLPQTREDYIHRIGRTGRANKTGVALSFIE